MPESVGVASILIESERVVDTLLTPRPINYTATTAATTTRCPTQESQASARSAPYWPTSGWLPSSMSPISAWPDSAQGVQG